MVPEIHIIVAMSVDGAIGIRGDMPWGRNLPVDLAHFKETTMGYPVIMGRKTFETLPPGGLKGRQNVVITRNEEFRPTSILVARSPQEALELTASSDRVFVIGGGEIYRQMLPKAGVLHITVVKHSWKDADTFFPPISLDEWQCVESLDVPAEGRNLFDVSFTRWERIRSH